MSLLAFFAPNDISHSLLHQRVKSSEEPIEGSDSEKEWMPYVPWLREMTADKFKFKLIIGKLRSVSLISFDVNDKITIHPVVHSWALYRQWSHEMRIRQWEALAVLLRKSTFKNQLENAMVFWHPHPWIQPHLRPARTKQLFHDEFLLPEWDEKVERSECFELGRILSSEASFKDALNWYQRTLDSLQNSLGPEHEFTLNAAFQVGRIMDQQGFYGDAVTWFEKALDSYLKGLGENHSSTLNTMSSMAMALYRQDLYEQSIQWNRRALIGKEKLWGSEYPWTLITVLEMSTELLEQGLYDEALAGHRRALEVYEKLGQDHPLTIIKVRDMARVFERQG